MFLYQINDLSAERVSERATALEQVYFATSEEYVASTESLPSIGPKTIEKTKTRPPDIREIQEWRNAGAYGPFRLLYVLYIDERTSIS